MINNNQPLPNPNELLNDLVKALDNAFICNLQSTHYWKDELNKAREYIEQLKKE